MTDEQQIIETWRGSAETPETLSWISRTDKVRAVLACLALMLFLTWLQGVLCPSDKDHSLDRNIYRSLELAPLERLNGTGEDLMKGDGVACLIRTREEFEDSLSEIDTLNEDMTRKAELKGLVSIFEEGHVLLYVSSETGIAYWDEKYTLFSFGEGSHLVLVHELPGGGAAVMPDMMSYSYCLIELSAEEADRIREVDFQMVNLRTF